MRVKSSLAAVLASGLVLAGLVACGHATIRRVRRPQNP
jgi:hypothetical protein